MRAQVRILGLARHVIVWTFLPQGRAQGTRRQRRRRQRRRRQRRRRPPHVRVDLSIHPFFERSSPQTRPRGCTLHVARDRGKKRGYRAIRGGPPRERRDGACGVRGGTGRVRREAGPCSHEQGHHSANARYWRSFVQRENCRATCVGRDRGKSEGIERVVVARLVRGGTGRVWRERRDGACGVRPVPALTSRATTPRTRVT